jgi:outer membrane protein TolC
MDAAEDALEQITLRYQLGKTDYLSVLNVQTERSLARSNLIQARNEVLTLTATLKRALGFTPTVPLAEISAALASLSVQPGSSAEGRR